MNIKTLPNFNVKKETKRIISFIQKTLKNNRFQRVVIGVSGGIDSATSLFLLSKSIPSKHIFPVYMPYFSSSYTSPSFLTQLLSIPKENMHVVSIQSIVDKMFPLLSIDKKNDKLRLGNIIARIRMIILFDLAKKYNALVCGTENKSEHYLGYFTRFGDSASDFEPIIHLYKTQVYKIAEYLGVPRKIINKKPTADLWIGQTDEDEFGFSYQEADTVLYLFFDKKYSIEKIINKGYKNTSKIISYVEKNRFKHIVPYKL